MRGIDLTDKSTFFTESSNRSVAAGCLHKKKVHRRGVSPCTFMAVVTALQFVAIHLGEALLILVLKLQPILRALVDGSHIDEIIDHGYLP